MPPILPCDHCGNPAVVVVLIGRPGLDAITELMNRSWAARCAAHPTRADGLLIGVTSVIKKGE